MKILQVTSHFPPYRGGMETVVYYLSKGLASLGHDVQVITSNIPKCGREENFNKFNVKRVSAYVSLFGFPVISSLGEVINNDVDIVHVHVNSPLLAETAALGCAIKGIPLVVTYHSDTCAREARSSLKKLWFIAEPLYDCLLKSSVCRIAKKLTVSTPTYLDKSNFLRKFSDKVVVIPHGVDHDRFSPNVRMGERFKAECGFSESTRIITFVGRLAPYKGLPDLLKAFSRVLRKIEAVVLVLVGKGAEEKKLKALTFNLKIHDKVVFTGEVHDEILPNYYRMSDVLVLPSRSNAESFGLSLLEAMACGIPVVATRVGGVSYVVGEGGILVRPNSPSELAVALERSVTDDALRQELSGKALKESFRFTWGSTVKRTEELYTELLKRNQ